MDIDIVSKIDLFRPLLFECSNFRCFVLYSLEVFQRFTLFHDDSAGFPRNETGFEFLIIKRQFQILRRQYCCQFSMNRFTSTFWLLLFFLSTHQSSFLNFSFFFLNLVKIILLDVEIVHLLPVGIRIKKGASGRFVFNIIMNMRSCCNMFKRVGRIKPFNGYFVR